MNKTLLRLLVAAMFLIVPLGTWADTYYTKGDKVTTLESGKKYIIEAKLKGNTGHLYYSGASSTWNNRANYRFHSTSHSIYDANHVWVFTGSADEFTLQTVSGKDFPTGYHQTVYATAAKMKLYPLADTDYSAQGDFKVSVTNGADSQDNLDAGTYTEYYLHADEYSAITDASGGYSISYWGDTTTPGTGSQGAFNFYEVSEVELDPIQIESGYFYNFKAKGTNYYLSLSSGVKGDDTTDNAHLQVAKDNVVLTSSGDGYTIGDGNGNYMAISTATKWWNATISTTQTVWTIEPILSDDVLYYKLKCDKGYLGSDNWTNTDLTTNTGLYNNQDVVAKEALFTITYDYNATLQKKITEYTALLSTTTIGQPVDDAAGTFKAAIDAAQAKVTAGTSTADDITTLDEAKATFMAGTTLYLPSGYYYMKNLNTDSRPPYIFNAFQFSSNTNNYTLQSSTQITDNSGIWHVVNNGDNITITNGQGQGLNTDKGKYATLNFVAAVSGKNGIAFTQHPNATKSGRTITENSTSYNYLTTWTDGGASAMDNRWTFEAVESPTIYNVVVTGYDEGYVQYGTQYAKNGGFFNLSSTPTKDDFTPWTDERHTAVVTVDATNKTINVAYTSLSNITFVIMDESGNQIFKETKEKQTVGSTVTCSYTQPLYTAYSHTLSVTATSEDKTIYSTISVDGLPFTLSSSYEDGVWYDENGVTTTAYAYTGTPWAGIKRYTYGDSETTTDVDLSSIASTTYTTHSFTGPFTVTYVYKHNDETWYTEEHTGLELGVAYPSPTAPYGVTVTAPTGTVSMSKTVTLDCTVSLPFNFYSTYSADNDWYSMAITNSRYLFNYDSSADTYMTLSATTIPTEGSDNYYFQFVGNPYTGYKIYNKGAGDTKILSAIDPTTDTKDTKGTGGGAYILMRTLDGLDTDTYNTTWDFTVSTANSSGFFLRRHGQTYSANVRSDIVSNTTVLSFWTTASDVNSTIYIMSADQQCITTNPTTATPTNGKLYRIYNRSAAGHMLYNNGNTLGATNVKTTGDYTQMWLLEGTTTTNDDETTTTTWKLRSCSNGYQISNSSSKTTAMTLASSGGTFYLVASTDGTSYAISPASDPTSTEINMNWYNDSKIAGWSWNATHSYTGSEWVFEEVSEDEATLAECKSAAVAASSYAEVAAGKIYKIYNYQKGTPITENYLSGNGLSVTSSPDNQYSQYWKAVGTGDGTFALQNILTSRYVQQKTGYSSQFVTGTDPYYFSFKEIANEWDKPNYLINSGSTIYFHADAGNSVVGWWDTSLSNTQWKLQEVTLTDAEINQIASQYQDYTETYATYQNYKNNEDNYTSKLQKYFSDYACTTLTSTYTSKTAAELQADMEADGLPEPIITMALKVKNDSWESYVDGNEKLNEKFFRVQEYQIYSNESTWCGLLGASNARGRWSNPVGVVVPKSETAFVYVDQDIPTGATLQLNGIKGTDTGCKSWSLHKGVNVIQTTEIDRLYVYYMMDNTDADGNLQYLSKFPKIKVHVEGGYVNGYWDETRGMDNTDWTAMVNSDELLQYGYLDIKGQYMCMLMNAPIVKSVCPTRIADIMRVWNFIVKTEYEVMGVYYTPNDFGDRFNNLMNGFSVTYNYMFASTGGGYYNENTLSTIMNPDVMTRGGGNLWGPAHEMGHNNQSAMNMIGCTEISNNVFSNAVVWQWGTTTTRGAAAQQTFDKFLAGKCWYERDLWERTRLYYQLWQYFYVCKHDPDFYAKIYRALIADPMKHPGYCFTPAADDELHFAEICCQVAEMDLTEFFEVYGFFKKPTLTSYTLNGTTKDAYLVGDYSNYYVTFDSDTQTWEEQVAATKAKMATYTNKAGTNLMFIEDRIETTVSDDRTANPGVTRSDYGSDVAVGKCGDVGSFTQFTEEAQAASDASKYYYTIDGTTVTMVGSGAVGYKIYDADGNLVQLSSSNTFTVSAEIAAALAAGTYKLDVAESDGTSVELTDELNEANKKAASLSGVTDIANGTYTIKDGNDNYAHYSGTELLKGTAAQMRNQYEFTITQGTGDYAGRYTIQTCTGKYVTYSATTGTAVTFSASTAATDANKWWVFLSDATDGQYDIVPYQSLILASTPGWNFSKKIGDTSNAAVGFYNIGDANSAWKLTLATSDDIMSDRPSVSLAPGESDFDDDTKWHTMRLTADGDYFSNTLKNTDTSYMPMSTTTTSYADADLWCFVLDETNGDDAYTIYNREAGVGYILASETVTSSNTGSTYPRMLATTDDAAVANPTWKFTVSTNISGYTGFYLGQTSSGYRVNRQSSKLVYWSGADAGSTVRIDYVSPEQLVARNTVSTGTLYRLRNSAYPTKYMQASDDGTLLNANTLTSSAENAEIWILISAATEGEYYVYNPATKAYIGKVPSTGGRNDSGLDGSYGFGQQVPMTSTTADAGTYKFTATTTGFNITNTNSDIASTSDYRNLHLGSGSTIVVRWGSSPDASKWVCEYVEPLIGDANSDFNVSVSDLSSVVGYILNTDVVSTFNFRAADVNIDNKISVSDLSSIVGIILGSSSTEEARSAVSANEINTASCQTLNIRTGEDALLYVNVDNSVNVSAFQFDALLPEGFTCEDVTADYSRVSDGAAICSAAQKDGAMRVICYSMSDNTVSDNSGSVAILKIHADNNIAEGYYEGQLKNIELASGSRAVKVADAPIQITVGSTTDINGVDAEGNAGRIYDINGRLRDKKNAKNGVYISNNKKYILK